MNIQSLSLDELRALNKQVVARINELLTRNNREAALKFSVGDRVYFESNKRPLTHPGVVEKVNPTTILVKCDDGKRWRVAPALLKHEDLEAA